MTYPKRWFDDDPNATLETDLLLGESADNAHPHSFAAITGSIADAQVPASAVTQHQAALAVAFTQLTGTASNAQVPESAVTQHQAALSVAASQIASGTLAHERGGLEADVSAYSGLLKIAGGATLAVTVTSFAETLLDDADAATARATLAALGGALGSTDNRLVRTDGTGGATLQEAGVTVDDSGNVTADGNIAAGGNFVLADGRTVQAGAADSGGAGFRLLRIANTP